MALLFWKLSRSLAWHCWEVEIDEQNGNAAADYWIDDVAVSKSRIDCPTSK